MKGEETLMQNDLNDIEVAGSSIEQEATPDNADLSELVTRLELFNVDGDKSELERDKLKEEVENIKADRELRKKYASRVWGFLVCYLITVIVFLLMSGFSICGFKLHDAVLVTLAGSTAVAAIGLVGIIAKGLFNQPK